MIEETVISRAIIEVYLKELLDSVESDVIIAGAGPSGLCAGYYLAKHSIKTILFERALKLGGGKLLTPSGKIEGEKSMRAELVMKRV